MRSLSSRRSFVRTLSLLGCGLPFLASCMHNVRRQRIRRIGFLIGVGYPQLVTALNEELRKLGYIDGENLVLEMRQTQRDRSDLAAKSAELAGADLELIVASSLPFAVEVRKANPAMPMVIATCAGMVPNGFARSIEHPGGNVTGIDELPPGVAAKRLTLLKMMAPKVSRVALLSAVEGHGGHEMQLADAQAAAPALGITVKPYVVMSLAEIEQALIAMVDDGMNGLANFQGGLSLGNRQMIVDFAAKQRLPAIYQATLFAEAGGLMAWAPDVAEQYRMAARYVDQILRGARPGDLPVQFPPRYYLTINAAAAKGLNLALPRSMLNLADRVVS